MSLVKRLTRSDSVRAALCWLGSLYIRLVRNTGSWRVDDEHKEIAEGRAIALEGSLRAGANGLNGAHEDYDACDAKRPKTLLAKLRARGCDVVRA